MSAQLWFSIRITKTCPMPLSAGGVTGVGPGSAGGVGGGVFTVGPAGSVEVAAPPQLANATIDAASKPLRNMLAFVIARKRTGGADRFPARPSAERECSEHVYIGRQVQVVESPEQELLAQASRERRRERLGSAELDRAHFSGRRHPQPDRDLAGRARGDGAGAETRGPGEDGSADARPVDVGLRRRGGRRRRPAGADLARLLRGRDVGGPGGRGRRSAGCR